MTNQHDMTCPNCGASDEIDVMATNWGRLEEDGTDAFASHSGDTEWDSKSPCKCCTCEHVGTVAEFSGEEPAKAEPPNQSLIKRAEMIMARYAEITHDEAISMRDLLADLMHMAERYNIDFDHELSMATDFYNDEKEDQT